MKILITSKFYPPAYSGAAKRAQELAEYLSELHDVSVITTQLPKKIEYEKTRNVKIYKHQDFLVQKRLIGHVAFLINFFLCQQYIFRLRKEFDVIMIYGGFGLKFIPMAKLLGKTVVYRPTLHKNDGGGDDPSGLRKNGPIIGPLYRLLSSWANGYIAISTAIKNDFLAANYTRPIKQIPNHVDLKTFHPVGEEQKQTLRKFFGLPLDALIAVSAGAIEDRKGILELLDVWVEVVKEFPQAILLLVGPNSGRETPGSYVNRVHEHIDALNLTSNVILTGEVPLINQYLQASDIFVFASKKEGFGTVLVEALAVGLPVIAFEIEEVTRDILDDEVTGFVIARNDVPGFVVRVKQMFNDKRKLEAIAEQAQKSATKRFSRSKILAEYEQFFNELLTGTDI
jgi:L-malate glycosyltransferase